MNLKTRYLGFELAHPLIVGACPIVDDLDLLQRMVDAGASAVVMHSLFEEQLVLEQMAHYAHVDAHNDVYAEATTIRPDLPKIEYALGPDDYLEQLHRIKERISVPLIASLNGVTDAGWLRYARLLEQAGADALELNVYYQAIDPAVSGENVEQHLVRMVSHVSESVRIPVAVKLSPFYSSFVHLATQLERAGADGFVLFNRFYEPDIDLDELELTAKLRLSDPSELLLRLRFIAALSPHTNASLAATGGVHSGLDALKAVMAGAHAVQLVSALLKRGPGALIEIRRELAEWLERHEYESLEQAQGSMNAARCPDASHYQRGNYLRILQSWRRSNVS